MKIKYVLILAALSTAAFGGPKPNGSATGHIPGWLDTDGDGIVSEAERQAFAESRGNANHSLFHRWDVNEDGVVDDQEKQDAINALRAKVTERRTQLFNDASGGDGELTLEDFLAIHPVGLLPAPVAARLFGLLDGDGDEIVTEDEFLSAVGPGRIPPNKPGDPGDPGEP